MMNVAGEKKTWVTFSRRELLAPDSGRYRSLLRSLFLHRFRGMKRYADFTTEGQKSMTIE
jgi:hypothetical protein